MIALKHEQSPEHQGPRLTRDPTAILVGDQAPYDLVLAKYHGVRILEISFKSRMHYWGMKVQG